MRTKDVRANEVRPRDTAAMLKLLAQSEESLRRDQPLSSAEVRRRAHTVIARAKRQRAAPR